MSFSSIFEVSRAELACLAGPPREPTPEALIVAEIQARHPGEPITYGIDAKGPYARIGVVEARRRPDCASSLRAALEAHS